MQADTDTEVYGIYTRKEEKTPERRILSTEIFGEMRFLSTERTEQTELFSLLRGSVGSVSSVDNSSMRRVLDHRTDRTFCPEF